MLTLKTVPANIPECLVQHMCVHACLFSGLTITAVGNKMIVQREFIARLQWTAKDAKGGRGEREQ